MSSSDLEKIMLSGLACQVAGFLTNWIDVIKVRLQLQGELQAAGSHQIKYRGFARGVATILQEEGARGLLRGVTPSLMREGTYSALRIGLYDHVKEALLSKKEHSSYGLEFPLWKKIVAGGTTGAIGSVLVNPTDLIKVQMQAELPGQPRRYKHTLDAFRQISKQHGVLGLWRGSIPTVMRAAIVTASQIPSYDHCKHFLIQRVGMAEGTASHLVASMFAGVVMATTTSPVDLVKSRYMTAKHGETYSSVWNCFARTYQVEGIMGFYKGWFPNWMRLGPHTIISFMLLEQFRAWWGIRPV